MRYLRLWWRSLVFSIQHNPPEFVEYLMVSFATALAFRWFFIREWPYLFLSSSLALGAGMSIWVRELLLPSPRSRIVMILFVIGLLLYSVCGFDVVRHYL